MSDRILLRMLTFKSKLGFGSASEEELTVEEAIRLEHNFKLIKAYYGLSKIGFTNEVLTRLGIPKDSRIDKPGKDEALGDKVMKALGYERAREKKKIRDKLLAKLALEGNGNLGFTKVKRKSLKQYKAMTGLN